MDANDDAAAAAPDAGMADEAATVPTDDNNNNNNPSETKEGEAETMAPSVSGKKRSRVAEEAAFYATGVSPSSVSTASAAAASQMAGLLGLQGLASLLSASVMSASGSSSGNATSAGSSSTLPSLEQVQQSANKFVADSPPFVHLSKTDSAPQLTTVGDDRLLCKGGMRGYRMARASHGVPVAGGNYYYECIIQEPPSVKDIINSMPSNVRISKKLQEEMQIALKLEEEREKQKEKEGDDDENKSDKDEENVPTHSFGSHVRLGWSMRTGDLQAPVGYDKWSFGVRDIGGSKIHRSQREDHWGGEEFGPGDVIGCAISMVPDSTMEGVPATGASSRNSLSSTGSPLSHQQHQAQLQQPQPNQNHIRFFKNGYPMGEFVISKGKREGGAAFIIPDGVYYPAVSLYMGASVKVNFGPNFIYQAKKLPTGMKLQPLSNLSSPPVSLEDATAKITKERPFRKPEMHRMFLELVDAEVEAMQKSYQAHRTQHVLDVMEERKKRGVNTDNLENDEYFPQDAMSAEE